MSDPDRLRTLLAMSPVTHVPASQYSGGKHVRGTNDNERQQNACQPGGAGQYRATHVDDGRITEWERVALERVGLNNGEFIVERRGEGYWIFCDMMEHVGFEGATGRLTCWIRVEWSAGSVHSHPRQPSG
jgi:hypothetical protein